MKTQLLVLMLSFGIATVAWAEEKEEKIKLKDCPAAVQKTIEQQAGDGKILEVEKETGSDGTVTYEAEIKRSNGSVFEVEVAADGKLIEVEEEDDEDDDDGDED